LLFPAHPSGTAIPPCENPTQISNISKGGMAVPDRYYAPLFDKIGASRFWA